MTNNKRYFFLFFLIGVLFCSDVQAQYFGKNKPRYRSFKFKVRETPNFDIYYYMKNRPMIDDIGKLSEMWYDYHNEIFQDSFPSPNPIVLYNNHADFQQTNTISGAIGVGTGGVTEAFKNRVVMPVTFTYDQTNHVLGHELVHAFQYNAILRGDSTNLQSLRNLPLWMVEGLAEYMSLGREDAFTAMWMRDAVINERVPPLKKLTNPRFFPYRYGQAVWAYITSVYGDEVIKPLFVNTAKYGLELACIETLGTTLEELSDGWRKSLNDQFRPLVASKDSLAYGKLLFSSENSGRINVSPSISPNGKYLIFMSEKDVFSSDLYLANAKTGKILRKLSDVFKNPGVDHLNLLESTGSWSPDSKYYAFVAFAKGRNVILVKDVETGATKYKVAPKGVKAIANPVWDKGGKRIIFTGKVEGQVDLYSVNIKNNRTKQITDTKYAETQPSISRDGKKIVFASDATSYMGKNIYRKMSIAVLDRETGSVKNIPLFNKGNHVSPQWDHEDNILFISDHDGYRNMYKYDVDSSTIHQLTDLKTGVSGITKYSPCISASTKKDAVAYSFYTDGEYHLYLARSKDFLSNEPTYTSDGKAGRLFDITGGNRTIIVDNNIAHKKATSDTDKFSNRPYRPKFKLDFVTGGGGIGVGTSSNSFRSANALQGGVQMLFSDILGNHQIVSTVALNGEIIDMGGQVSYLNRSNRLAWGVGFSHIPLRTGYQSFARDSLVDGRNNTKVEVLRRDQNIIRLFREGISGFVHYPFSTTLRIEGSLQGNYQSFRQDQYSDYFDVRFSTPQQVYSSRQRVKTGDEIVLNRYYTIAKGFGANANVALVGDNSFFGLTAPLSGYRYRISMEKNFGINSYYAGLADARLYYRMNPVTFALRGMSYMRFEEKVKSVYPIYIGNMGFVRGYQSLAGPGFLSNLKLDNSQLLGSKLLLSSAEVRLPFTGPGQIAVINSNLLFSDLNLFVDAGVVFDEFSHLSNGEEVLTYKRDSNGNIILDRNSQPVLEYQTLQPHVATSAGISLRINLFGALIVEPYYAWSLGSKNRTFGVNLSPGW